MIRIHFTSTDLVRTHLAMAADPMWEITLSLHLLQPAQVRGARLAFDPWRHEVRERLHRHDMRTVVRDLLIPLDPADGDFPDFLTPAEGILGLEEGIDAVLSTPRGRIRADLEPLTSWRTVPSWAKALAAGECSALHTLGDALRSYHEIALAPYWPRIRTGIDADRAMRARALIDGGPHFLLENLHPKIHWRPPVLEITHTVDRDIHLSGRGLTLIPSHFCWHNPIPLSDPALPPVLIYPIERGLRWLRPRPAPDAPDGALAALLGRTRAATLRATTNGATTTELARHTGVTPPAASQHTEILRDAGLITSRRYDNRVIHTVTPLGAALLHQIDQPGAAAASLSG